LLDSFTGQFELLAWDYPGLGRSVPLTGPYTMADLAADVAGLLDMAGGGARPGPRGGLGGVGAPEVPVPPPRRGARPPPARHRGGGRGRVTIPAAEGGGAPARGAACGGAQAG